MKSAMKKKINKNRDVSSKVSRHENIKPLVSIVRQPETRLRCLHADLCVNCSQRAGVGDMKLNEEPITILKFFFIHWNSHVVS